MQNYTLTILIKDKVTEDGRKAIFEAVKKSFTSLIKEDLWGVRSLAYDIKHNNKAFYAHFEFEAEPEAIIALDKNIRLNEDIIRHLIIKTKVKKQRSKGKTAKQNLKVSEEKSEVKEAEEKIESKDEEVKEIKRVSRKGK